MVLPALCLNCNRHPRRSRYLLCWECAALPKCRLACCKRRTANGGGYCNLHLGGDSAAHLKQSSKRSPLARQLGEAAKRILRRPSVPVSPLSRVEARGLAMSANLRANGRSVP